MFKITLLFKSNIVGVYTKEEETATDKITANCKKARMIQRWCNILCPHIDIDKYYCDTVSRLKFNRDYDLHSDLMLHLINETLKSMDYYDEKFSNIETKREFEITIEEF